MGQFRVFTAGEQVAGHLREELRRGTWTGMMPGEDRLMARLGVGRNTIKAALRQLEEEGLLEGRGAGHRRRIAPQKKQRKAALRIRILLYEANDRGPDIVELMARLQEAGFAASFAAKSLHDLRMDAGRVASFVADHPADAWVVSAGSREVLEWFSGQPFPAIAMFGRGSGLPIAVASVRNIPPMIEGVRKLISHGHSRIVMLAREERRKPSLGLAEKAFLDELSAQGLPIGPYNLPNWDDTPAGLLACLHSLFQSTPPSALIIGDTQLFVPVQQFLARRGIQVPERVSLFIIDADAAFAWADPPISHIRWDYRLVVRRILHWADNVAHGRDDREQEYIRSNLFEGGTMGPAH